MVQIAQRRGEKSVSSLRAASAIGISVSYAEQLAADLRRHGLIRSFRGPGGGYVLTKPAREIAILDIVLAVEGGESSGRKKADVGLLFSRNPQAADFWGQMEKFRNRLMQQIFLADVVNGGLADHPLFKRVFSILD